MQQYLLYILHDGNPVPCADLLTWQDWMAHHETQVARTVIGAYRVSTAFIGRNHQFGNGPPLVFETMVFGDGPLDGFQMRYPTEYAAIAGHQALCNQLEYFYTTWELIWAINQ